jgi:hypothetical protein
MLGVVRSRRDIQPFPIALSLATCVLTSRIARSKLATGFFRRPVGGRRIIKSVSAAVLLIAVSGDMTPILAQTVGAGAASAPDKSSYTLFNPTPVDQMRPFCTDRPTKANVPCTVDAGHFQYESDVINWTYAHTDGETVNNYLIPNPTFKLGLTNTVDLELNIAPVETVSASGPLGKQSLTGVSNLFMRAKVNVAGPEGGDFQAAILPYLEVPTAKPGVGNKAVQAGVIAPMSFGLPQDFTLLFDPEIDILRNAENSGRHVNFQNLANVSHALSDSITGYIELWGQINNDPAGTTKQASLDLALSWLVWPDLPNLQFDIGANIGLTSATPKIQVYIGVSQRF